LPVLEEFSLSGKVALVATGESPGGEMLAPFLREALVEAGARVLVLARSQGALSRVSPGATAPAGETHGILCDATREGDVRRALAEAAGRWGRIDILVNVFRSEFARPFQEVTLSEFQAVMDRNVKAVFLLCRETGKRMLSQGGGRIINVISGMAERGLWNSAAYCASQGAVLQLTRSLALEWGRKNIRVNAIGTGWFSTEEPAPEEAQKELLVRYIPLRRRGHPRDIGPLLVYLASDACDYTTGQPVYVDGGLMAHP
jgi:NAD(P)-dependent dehydrogenase (short-subunit alcohol dehydrogenase family)